jgi:hypothetical protein
MVYGCSALLVVHSAALARKETMARMSFERYKMVALYALTAAFIILAVGVAVVVSTAGLLALLIMVGIFAGIHLMAIGYERLKQRVTARIHGHSDGAPRTPRKILAADGHTIPAWVVPMEQPEGHEMLLTSKGYVIVNGQGKVIHILG